MTHGLPEWHPMIQKKALILFLLLALVILIGRLILREDNSEANANDLGDFATYRDEYQYVLSHYSPVFYTQETPYILGPKRDYLSLFYKYEWDPRVAYAVMMAESGGDPNSLNPEWHYKNRVKHCQGSYGLMQMACSHIGNYGLTADNIRDPEANIHAAYLLWKERGWKPWGAYTNGSYKKFL